MAIVWADGFDHYGTSPNNGRNALLSGAWAQLIGNGTRISTTQKRTGSYSLYIPHDSLSNNQDYARRVYGSDRSVCGIGFGLYLSYLPSGGGQHGFQFRSAANDPIVSVFYETDGSFLVRKGGGGVDGVDLGRTNPAITAQGWNHIECKLNCDSVVGSVQIKVNGSDVFHMTDLDLGNDNVATINVGSFDVFGTSIEAYYDDMVAWDDLGTVNNDFLGQQRVETIWPVADTAVADWSITGAATGYEAIDEVPPDDDTTYIYTETANDRSEFELGDLPPKTAQISAVYVPVRAKLEAAGVGNLQVSIVGSSGGVSAGPSEALTSQYTYRGSVHETNPDTGLPWTKAEVEAAKLRVEKTV